MMNDSESDTGSLDGGLHPNQDGNPACFQPPSPVSREQLQKRIESLQQQNRVLNMELETYKLRVKSLQVSRHFISCQANWHSCLDINYFA